MILRERVLKYVPLFKRPFHYHRVLSAKENSAAYVLHTAGSRRDLWMMARSLLRWPVGDLHRYKVSSRSQSIERCSWGRNYSRKYHMRQVYW